MPDIYKDEDTLLCDYRKLSQTHKNKAGTYIKNLLRLQKADAALSAADTQIHRELKSLGLKPHDEFSDIHCSFCNKPCGDCKKLIAGPKEVYICDLYWDMR